MSTDEGHQPHELGARVDALLAATSLGDRSTEPLFPTEEELARLSDTDYVVEVESALARKLDPHNNGAMSARSKFKRRVNTQLALIKEGRRLQPAQGLVTAPGDATPTDGEPE